MGKLRLCGSCHKHGVAQATGAACRFAGRRRRRRCPGRVLKFFQDDEKIKTTFFMAVTGILFSGRRCGLPAAGSPCAFLQVRGALPEIEKIFLSCRRKTLEIKGSIQDARGCLRQSRLRPGLCRKPPCPFLYACRSHEKGGRPQQDSPPDGAPRKPGIMP